ncbi:MAG TPA: DMT family transporter [Candidatus Binatia bacterium]
MIYLLLAIIGSGLIPVLFRGFADWRVNVFWAIPINYLTCVIAGGVWGGHPLALSTLASAPWLWLAMLQGGILAINFFLLAYTAQRVGVSVAALASRLSVAIPSILAFLFYGDSFSAAKIAGLAAALLSLYLCTASTEKSATTRPLGLKLLPLLVFLTFGCYFIVIKYAQSHYLSEASFHDYVMAGFLFGFLTALAICSARRLLIFKQFRLVHVVAGLILGVVNYVAVYTLIKALALEGWESSQLYPMYSVGVVAVSTGLAMLLFNEKLSNIRKVGLVVGVIAVALLNR